MAFKAFEKQDKAKDKKKGIKEKSSKDKALDKTKNLPPWLKKKGK
jgi:hypothetical protein